MGGRLRYMNENGKNTTLWPGFTWKFRQQTRWFDDKQYWCEYEVVAIAEETLNRSQNQR